MNSLEKLRQVLDVRHPESLDFTEAFRNAVRDVMADGPLVPGSPAFTFVDYLYGRSLLESLESRREHIEGINQDVFINRTCADVFGLKPWLAIRAKIEAEQKAKA